MRYVNIAQLRPPNGWIKRAGLAAEAVAAGADPNDHSGVWRTLKDGLADLLHDKCWYCEYPVPRADNAVDHFRPKGRVSDAESEHRGYRWLAFERTNFRYACTFCNSRRKDLDGGTVGGKGDRFPLLDESKRVYEKGSVEEEDPVLLDPCVYSDCQLLGCQRENGHPCATGEEEIGRRRAEESIEIYHLNHEPTCKRRHARAVEFMANLEEGKRRFSLATKDAGKKRHFVDFANGLLQAISLGAEFSGEMRFLMRGERSQDHPWIQELLEA